jgi:hypothetical protein
MDALDTYTLRKRRDRLYNPITAPAAVLEAAMFQYVPPPPVPPAYHAVHMQLQGIPPAAFQGMADYFRVQQAAAPPDGQRNVRPRLDPNAAPAQPPPAQPPPNMAPPGIPPAAFQGLADALFVQGAGRAAARAMAEQRNYERAPAMGTRAQRQRVA